MTNHLSRFLVLGPELTNPIHRKITPMVRKIVRKRIIREYSARFHQHTYPTVLGPKYQYKIQNTHTGTTTKKNSTQKK